MRQLQLFQDEEPKVEEIVPQPSPAELEAIRQDEETQSLARLTTPEARQRYFAERAAAERRAARSPR